MKLKKLINLERYEDGQMRGIARSGMIPITWDLWTYATLIQIVETREPGGDLIMPGFVIEGFREISEKEKPHYKEFLDVLIDRYPIFEVYRILAEEQVI